MYIIPEACLNPRQCIETAIRYFRPEIEDSELLDLREILYLKVYNDTARYNVGGYIRDYQLYTKKEDKNAT